MAHTDKTDQLPMPKKDKLSLGIAILSLIVALFTLYYSTLDKRYLAYVAYGQTRLNVTLGGSVKVDGQTLSFANGGNQPISIQRLGYSVFSVRKEPNKETCPEDIGGDDDPGRLSQLALSKTFKPFTVKPGEIEVQTHAFEAQIPADQLKPSKGGSEGGFVVACLFMEIFSVGTGAKQVSVPVASEKRSLLERASFLGSVTEGKPFLIVDRHWPFY